MPEIIIHKAWVHNASAGMHHSLRGDLDLLKAQVNQGFSQLWEINTPKGKSWMITRVESLGDQRELVICCYEGCDLKTVAPIIYKSAECQGFNSIRFHTQRKGLNRLVVDLGFIPYETVYKKQLKKEVA